MLKASQRETSTMKRSSGSISKMKIETDYESAANGARQRKIWGPGERQQVTTDGDLQNKVWDPGGQEKKSMIRRS